MSTPDNDLGPLPASDENSELQRRSLKVLGAALPSDEFVLRDERIEDFGVDVTLEVISKSRATNCRAQLQVKGRSNLQTNADGSFSVSVETSNLNYLLNGPCPLYILFRPEGDQLLFAFAMDEQRRISELDESWQKKNSVTIRFKEVLDAVALKRIAYRIVDEAQRHRRLRDALASAEPASLTRVEFDARQSPNIITDASKAEEILLQDGMRLSSWGFASRVLELGALIPAARYRAVPKLLLVRGYAEFSNGNYLAADVSLRVARAKQSQLDPEEQHFLTYLGNVVAFVFGEISAEEFRSRADAWRVAASDILGMQYDVLRLWTLRTDTSTPEEAQKFETELTRVLQHLDASADAAPGVSQQAQLLLLFHQAKERVMALTSAVLNSHSAEIWRYAYDEPPAEVIMKELRLLDEWRAHVANLVERIRVSANAPLFCQALHTRDIVETFLVSQLRLAAQISRVEVPSIPVQLLEQLHLTQDLAAKFDQPELELRSRLLEAEIADLSEDRAKAIALANEVCELAEALRFADIVRASRNIIRQSHHGERQEEIRQLHEDGFVSAFTSMSDADLDRFARDTCDLMRVPSDRFPIVRSGVACQRELAKNQLSWCRHIEIMEDTTHQAKPETLFAWYPECVAQCALLKLRSTVPSSDWSAVLAAFKSAYCVNCTSRSPHDADKGHGTRES